MFMNTFSYILYGCYALFIIIRQVFNVQHQFQNRQAAKEKSDGLESALSRAVRNSALNLLILVVIIHAFNPPWLRILNHEMPSFLRVLGAMVALLGLFLLLWTHIHLGKQWSADLEIQSEHNLITSGPYRFIRHPMYTALYGFFLGTALLSGNYVMEILSILIIALIQFRIAQEEKMLQAEFGDEYVEYSKITGLLLPRFKN